MCKLVVLTCIAITDFRSAIDKVTTPRCWIQFRSTIMSTVTSKIFSLLKSSRKKKTRILVSAKFKSTGAWISSKSEKTWLTDIMKSTCLLERRIQVLHGQGAAKVRNSCLHAFDVTVSISLHIVIQAQLVDEAGDERRQQRLDVQP